MLSSRYRRWVYLLVFLLVFAEICTALSEYMVLDLITTVLAIIGSVVILELLVHRMTRRRDRIFRRIVFIPVFVFLVFKLWILFELVTQFK